MFSFRMSYQRLTKQKIKRQDGEDRTFLKRLTSHHNTKNNAINLQIANIQNIAVTVKIYVVLHAEAIIFTTLVK